jgi:hypothetical protein
VGDVALLMAIAWILNFGGWNYIYYLDFLANSFEINLISLLVVLAAITKSYSSKLLRCWSHGAGQNIKHDGSRKEVRPAFC